jgi:hypothetical protein
MQFVVLQISTAHNFIFVITSTLIAVFLDLNFWSGTTNFSFFVIAVILNSSSCQCNVFDLDSFLKLLDPPKLIACRKL